MTTKIVVGVVAVLVLALSGTIGVAYYNDPTLFDREDAPICITQEESAPGCCMFKNTPPCSEDSGETAAPCDK